MNGILSIDNVEGPVIELMSELFVFRHSRLNKLDRVVVFMLFRGGSAVIQADKSEGD